MGLPADHGQVRREGLKVNAKRLYRFYRTSDLVMKRVRKRRHRSSVQRSRRSSAYLVSRSPVDDALSGWTGTIQGDCFASDVRLDGRADRYIALAACWAHAR